MIVRTPHAESPTSRPVSVPHPLAGRRLEEAVRLMAGFAERTGLVSGPPRRYLWTDAFAVCNLLGLARATRDAGFAALALRLVEQVHATLGRHRPDDLRRGWLSGLDEPAGRAHPTLGGLRIGKPLAERSVSKPFDAGSEWERDGQYFHYLTKWMHALDQAARATGDPRFNLWGRELARAACAAFVQRPAWGPPRLAWKMSIDLSRAVVEAPGQHDPLDGFITLAQLRATADALPKGHGAGPDLTAEIGLLASLSTETGWVTGDLLGIGGLLGDACRLAQLRSAGSSLDSSWLTHILQAALTSLQRCGGFADLRREAPARLAFRELGFAIGLEAIAPIGELVRSLPERFPNRTRILALIDALVPYVPFGAEIESFWRRPEHREDPVWREHADINDVMLATRLAPEGFLMTAVPVAGLAAVAEDKP